MEQKSENRNRTLPDAARKYCNYLSHLNRSPKTIFQYSQDLLTFFRYMLSYKKGLPIEDEAMRELDVSGIGAAFLEEITRDDIYEYMMYITSERGNQAASRARKLSAVKGFFKYLAVIDGALPENPAETISTPNVKKKLPKYLTEEEALRLLEAVRGDRESKSRARDYAIITLFLNCGIRLAELCGISLRDLDPELRSMRVVGKGSKERIVYLNDACRQALLDYLQVRRDDPDIKDKNALFISRLGKRISYRTVQETVYKYLDAAGLGYKHFSTHKLRHTAATLMYQSGNVDVRVLKDILGHEQLNTTQIYTHVSDRQMEAAMAANPLSEVGVKKKKEEGE